MLFLQEKKKIGSHHIQWPIKGLRSVLVYLVFVKIKQKNLYVYECLCKFGEVWKKEGKAMMHAVDNGYFKALKIK